MTSTGFNTGELAAAWRALATALDQLAQQRDPQHGGHDR